MVIASPRKCAMAWIAAVIAAGAVIAGPAEARMGGFGGLHGGMMAGGFHGPVGGFGGIRSGTVGGTGFHRAIGGFGGLHRPAVGMNPGFASRPLALNRTAAFGRPAVFGDRVALRHPVFFHHQRRFDNAFAVGLIGGAALGPLGYGYLDDGYPSYATAAYGEDCWVVRHWVRDPWGHPVLRRVLVCS